MRRTHVVALLLLLALTSVRAQSARFPVDRDGARADGKTDDAAATQLQDVRRVDLDHVRAQRPGTTTRALLAPVRLDKVVKAY